MKVRHLVTTIAVVVGALGSASAAQAATTEGAVISNGVVQLGVNAQGSLNYDCAGNADPAGCPADSLSGASAVGVRFIPLNADATAPGCLCEGWGAADATSGLNGDANKAAGDDNITVDAFEAAADGRSAKSTVTISDATKPDHKMQVVHDYHPSPRTANAMEALVTITNTGTQPLEDLRYRRAMDWDVEPTAFDEWVTLQGSSDQLIFSSDDGFADTNPLAGPSYESSETKCGAGYTGVCLFKDLGATGEYPASTEPSDHGALFDFKLGRLAPGETKRFFVLYGAAPNETEAMAAVTATGSEVYSLGQSDCPETAPDQPGGCDGIPPRGGVETGAPVTFFFGFVTSTADLAIAKGDAPDPVVVGSDVTYTLNVTNTGPDRASGARVSDTVPAGMSILGATSSQGSCAASGQVVDCDLGTINSGGTATITITVRTTTVGDFTNTATVSAASADPNPGNNTATAATRVNAVPPPAPSVPPVQPNPLLACTKRNLVLIDVVPVGGKVTLLGAADPALRGRTVDLVFTATGKRVARAVVAADGTFAKQAPLPPRNIRNTSRARYQARIGSERSEQLKLTRRMRVTSIRSRNGRVTIKGRITRPLGVPLQSVTLQQRTSCATNRNIKTFKPRRNGTFSVTVPNPKGVATAVYVLRTKVRNNTRSRRLFLTKTLPRPVTLR